AGLVIPGNNDEGIAIFLGKLQYFSDSPVKVDHFFYNHIHIIPVSAPIDVRTFHHKKKPFFIFIENIDRRKCCSFELITAFRHYGFFEKAGKLSALNFCNFFQVKKNLESFFLQLTYEVASIRPFREVASTGTYKKINGGVDIIGSNFIFHGTGWLMCDK